MPAPAPYLLSDETVRAIAHAAAGQPRCAACKPLSPPGWEALSAIAETGSWDQAGTLHDGGDELSLEEYHPDGTSYWSPDAPIALGKFPYNHCTVWVCRNCAGAFLRYTEYGGYYEEGRIRPLQEKLIVRPI
jgi:hypothetical protein